MNQIFKDIPGYGDVKDYRILDNQRVFIRDLEITQAQSFNDYVSRKGPLSKIKNFSFNSIIYSFDNVCVLSGDGDDILVITSFDARKAEYNLPLEFCFIPIQPLYSASCLTLIRLFSDDLDLVRFINSANKRIAQPTMTLITTKIGGLF